MWATVIGTVVIFAFGIFLTSWILFKTDEGSVDHEWLQYSNCIWFTFSTFIGESVMRLETICYHITRFRINNFKP